MTHTNVASPLTKAGNKSVEAIQQMLIKRGYEIASIDAFMPRLSEVFSHEALKDAKPEDLVSYVESLLIKTSKAAKENVISLRFSAKDVPLERLDV